MTAAPAPAPTVAVAAGSGLDLVDLLDCIDQEIPFAECSGLPQSSVAGHAGKFVVGRRGDRRIVIQMGRLHVYEGHPIRVVQQTVDVLKALRVEELIITNAAGGLDPALAPGTLVGAERLLLWPYLDWPDAPASIDTDFLMPGCDGKGTYVWVHGPSYETPAEIMLMQRAGAAAVGMSSAPELDRCKALGIRAAVVSCITNQCGAPEKLTHEHVLGAAQAASDALIQRLRDYVDAPSSQKT